MGCNRLGTAEDKEAVLKEVAVAEAQCAAPDCTGAEVRAAFEQGGMPAVRMLQYMKEMQLRAAHSQMSNSNTFTSIGVGLGQVVSFAPANSDEYRGVIHTREVHYSAKHGTDVERETATATYQGPPENSRKTAGREDAKNRHEFRAEYELVGTTDQAGHKLGLRLGIPLGSTAQEIASDRQNLSAQSEAVNVGAKSAADGVWHASIWFDAEQQIVNWLTANPDTPLRVAVTTVSFPDKRGNREAHRVINFALPNGTCPPELAHLNELAFANAIWNRKK